MDWKSSGPTCCFYNGQSDIVYLAVMDKPTACRTKMMREESKSISNTTKKILNSFLERYSSVKCRFSQMMSVGSLASYSFKSNPRSF